MTTKKRAPFGLGFNGHAYSCDCVRLKLPTSAAQPVFVRAHYKRSPNHLRKYSRTRTMLRATLKRFVS
jgi:hypothetical protein